MFSEEKTFNDNQKIRQGKVLRYTDDKIKTELTKKRMKRIEREKSTKHTLFR